MLLLYVGPDQHMPIASFLGTVAGLLMIFWVKIVHFCRRVLGFNKPTENVEGPAEKAEGPQQE